MNFELGGVRAIEGAMGAERTSDCKSNESNGSKGSYGGVCSSSSFKDFLDSFIMLQDEDKDILSKEGFQDALLQNEIKAQFEMISLLKEKKLTSEFKHSLRK